MSAGQIALPSVVRRRPDLARREAAVLETGRRRLALTSAMFLAAFLAVAARLVEVGVDLDWGSAALADGSRAAGSLVAERGEIVDRNGVILAISVPSATLVADARDVEDAGTVVARLVEIIPDLDVDAAMRRLDSERAHVVLHRDVTPTQHQQIHDLGLVGVSFERGRRRIHPQGRLLAHLVGATNPDGDGLVGIENGLQDRLVDGDTVRLSVDVRLQQIVREEVLAAVREFRARAGVGLVMDVNTGEVLSMVSLPDFDPDSFGSASDDAQRNNATLAVHEMGSTFKVLTTAMALDAGVAGLTTGFDATRPLRVHGHVINDYHGQGRWLTLVEVLRHSSNIGTAQLARMIGTERQRSYLDALGMLDRPDLELSETGYPIVPSPWRDINTMTIGFGHGLSVSALQLVSAISAVVNGGIHRSPTLLAVGDGDVDEGTRVFDPRTSDLMRRLMRDVVINGTGGNADADGYIVGGKTGTAEKVRGGVYGRRALLSSFVAAFPMHRPRFVVFTMLDEPVGNESTYGYATGGWVAAPAVGRIIERMGLLYGVPRVDPDDPLVREAIDLPAGIPAQVTAVRQ